MKTSKIVLGLVFGLALTTQTNAQGLLDGFTPKKGDLSVTASYTSSNYEKFYAGETKMDAVPAHNEIDQNVYSLYAKYGITNKLSVVLNAPYISAEGNGIADPLNGTTKQDGFQDISIGLKYNAYTFNFEKVNLDVITGLSVDIPTGYEANGILSLGNNTFSTNLTAGLHLQNDVGLFATFLNSYQFRGDADNTVGGADFDVPNAYYATTKIGYASSLIYVEGWLDYLASTDGVDIGGAGFTGNNFPETKVEYTRLGATIYKNIIPELGASVGFSAVVDGRNIGKSTNYSVGLTYNLNL
ncbi:transporter [Polaribacter sp. Z014]|uniref:transporter n=1 Tax=Polaribacter sp. Z014 TaxID=2927126 RepID=UPI002020E2DD|nr:transporter [Polaribacter sp. Z014]MCL7763764.1 transporter [Polaribacter sp. Z014]